MKISTVKATKTGWLINNKINLKIMDVDAWEHGEELKSWFQVNKAEPMYTQLDKVKMNKLREIKQFKKTYQNEPFEFDGHIYKGGVEQANKLALAIKLAEDMKLSEGTIFDIENNEVTIDNIKAKELSIAFNSKLYSSKRKEVGLLKEIDEATTIDDINKIVW